MTATREREAGRAMRLCVTGAANGLHLNRRGDAHLAAS